jgi:hypothetical protein
VSASTDIECFRIDESGYTGFDLLNLDQRFQGASAIAISDKDAARLIKQHFPRLQASELKYRSLASIWKSPTAARAATRRPYSLQGGYVRLR